MFPELYVVSGLESAELVQALWLVPGTFLIVDAVFGHADVLPLNRLGAFKALLFAVLKHNFNIFVVPKHVLLVVVCDQGRLRCVILDLEGFIVIELGLIAFQVQVGNALFFVENTLVDRGVRDLLISRNISREQIHFVLPVYRILNLCADTYVGVRCRSRLGQVLLVQRDVRNALDLRGMVVDALDDLWQDQLQVLFWVLFVGRLGVGDRGIDMTVSRRVVAVLDHHLLAVADNVERVDGHGHVLSMQILGLRALRRLSEVLVLASSFGCAFDCRLRDRSPLPLILRNHLPLRELCLDLHVSSLDFFR